ncbi:centrosomal protein of 152 kDa isoform X6 [Chrysemys picta bellii]|uniref:centrosomal protein of 152 kDa isoform X6 n=1 Tax=Chrysemys picta bellii TaxID=8478 RepID=UPI0032B2449C
MYCPDLPIEGQYMAMYRNLSEGLEEQVHSIQDSLFQLQQLLTDLPHDMLDDSGDQLSNYSDCSIHEDAEQAHEPWEHEARWNDHLLITNPQSGYEQGQNLYPEQFLYDQGNNHGETHASNWTDQLNADKERCIYEIKEDYSDRQSEEDPDDVYLGRDGYKAPSHCQQNNVYHLPENFRPYTNGHTQELNNQQNKTVKFPDAPKEHLKQFGASEVANGQTVESYKVTYKPYQNAIQQKVPITQDATRRNEVLEEMQREFLGTEENSADNMQILQLQVLNKARERQLEELTEKMEKSAQQIRYLNHQLAMVKDEKDGLALSLQESQKLYQNGKEREIHLEGQIKALETQIQTLTANEEQLFKQSKVAELAMESMQQQLLELRRSDSLQRAREQHETIVAALKQKYEEQVLSLEQKLDATNSILQEQKDLCCNLREHVKQLERMLEESKLEKTEIINRLTRSLEESQKQCANLLQTGSIQETNQLRLQLQQAQSAQLISNNMSKTLQEELTELKEEIALYESAAKLGVFLNDSSGELHVDMTDSYVDLGIKKVNWKKSRFHSTVQNRDLDKELSKDELILELKTEMERLLGSNKMKRNQISQLQNDLQDSQRTTEELKQLLKTDKTANENEPKISSVENLTETLWSTPSASDNYLQKELLRLRKVNQDLQQEAENYSSCIRELKASEEKLKIANQDLCSQMRQMIQDFDRDKQEAVDRCERTYQQHHEDTKAQLREDLMERHAAEKEQLIQAYEETISKLKADMDELNKEMIAVKECYIAVCGEKDTLETTLRKKLEQEQQSKEEKFKKQLLEEKEDSLNHLRTELEEKHRNSIITAKSQWLKEKEVNIKQQVENEVALAKVQWEKEQKEIKEQAIQEIERVWQSRLDRTLEETKKALVELQDCGSQTDQVTITDETSSKEIARMVKEQKLQLEEALKEKEKAVREALKELETELERKHHENIASQVETALTKAHARWLKELTELEEYKANLKAEREKWEREYEINAAKQKHEELIFSLKETEQSCVQNGEGETGDKARPPMYDVGLQVEIQRILRRQPPLQDAEMDNDQKCKKRNLWSHEDFCCDHCCQQLETKERECQDLKRKLEKACRHLQLAVREHKAKVEQIRENERVLEALMEENCEMKMKLKDLKTYNTPPRSLSEGAISKPCTSCDGVKGLEEMRSQYIKAVGKIKGDMLRYIHESKERAAEMIKAEVLRERQETARKMRKYYLICLQQLLNDDGKHEGAEKKIMNAASKLATMAKVLETPVRSTPQNKNAHSTLPLNSELATGVEQSKRNHIHQTRPAHMESKSCGESIAKKASDQVVQKRVPYNLRQQLDAVEVETQSGLHERGTSNIQSSRSTSKQPADNSRDTMLEFCPAEDGERHRNGYDSNTDTDLTNTASTTALQKTSLCVPQVKFGNTHIPSSINSLSDSGPAHVMFENQTQRPVLNEFKCNQPNRYGEATSERTQGFDIQETPVRDDGSATDWSSINGSLHFDSGDMPFLYPVQKVSSNSEEQHMACEQFPITNLFPNADENVGTFCRQFTSKAKILGAKSEAVLYSNEQLNVNPKHNSYKSSAKSNSDVSQQRNAIPYSSIGKGYNQHSRKLILDAKSFHQDSGFDSPLPNLD